MEILFYYASADADAWLRGLRERLPGAAVRQWVPGDNQRADYAVVRRPPEAVLAGRAGLKAVFSLSAGVDDILAALRADPAMLPAPVPLFRLEDAGMADQMREYAVCTVLGWYRRFGEYREQQAAGEWREREILPRESFVVGILGAGVLGLAVAGSLEPWGFPLRCWSRGPKNVPGVASYYGEDQLPAFLSGTRALINLLPDTPRTRGILNRDLFRRLERGAFVMNIARGAHLVEDDLLAALDAGEIGAAALDVFAVEPLPPGHPFWTHPRISITPHCAARTVPGASLDTVASAIRKLGAGELPGGLVDRGRGY